VKVSSPQRTVDLIPEQRSIDLSINQRTDSPADVSIDDDTDVVSRLRSIQQAVAIETLALQRLLKTNDECSADDIQSDPPNDIDRTPPSHKDHPDPDPVSVDNVKERDHAKQDWVKEEQEKQLCQLNCFILYTVYCFHRANPSSECGKENSLHVTDIFRILFV